MTSETTDYVAPPPAPAEPVILNAKPALDVYTQVDCAMKLRRIARMIENRQAFVAATQTQKTGEVIIVLMVKPWVPK